MLGIELDVDEMLRVGAAIRLWHSWNDRAISAHLPVFETISGHLSRRIDANTNHESSLIDP